MGPLPVTPQWVMVGVVWREIDKRQQDNPLKKLLDLLMVEFMFTEISKSVKMLLRQSVSSQEIKFVTSNFYKTAEIYHQTEKICKNNQKTYE